MKSVIVDGDSLHRIGINIVTGEACALSMRLLCKLDKPAMESYIAYTGIRVSIDDVRYSEFNSAYHVFLTREAMEDLMIFHLMQENEMVVEILPKPSKEIILYKFLLAGTKEELKDHLQGDRYDHYVYDSDQERSIFVDGSLYEVGRSYSTYSEQPRVGFSNVSAFTGTYH